jgi:hypothetical protein
MMTQRPEIVELQTGGDPPNEGQWIMIVLQDEHAAVEAKRHSRGHTILAPPTMETTALERAEAIAQDEGIGTFYIRRDGNAPQQE